MKVSIISILVFIFTINVFAIEENISIPVPDSNISIDLNNSNISRDINNSDVPIINNTNILSANTNDSPKQKTKEINEQTYQEIIELLKPKNEDPEIVRNRLIAEKEQKEQERLEKQLEEERQKEIENMQFEEKSMLPSPSKSIKIGEKVIVYGIYKEKVIYSISDKSEIKYKLEDREIKLNKNDSFGQWKISRLNENFVTYENIETEEIIKKYY